MAVRRAHPNAKQATLHYSALTSGQWASGSGGPATGVRYWLALPASNCDTGGEGGRVSAMSRVRPALLVACLLGTLASACSHAEPTPKDFIRVDQRPAKAEEAGNTLEKAELACKEQTKQKAIGSVVAIFSRFRQGSADEDYVACMKRRGYEAKP
jgi:hypothetical protein